MVVASGGRKAAGVEDGAEGWGVATVEEEERVVAADGETVVAVVVMVGVLDVARVDVVGAVDAAETVVEVADAVVVMDGLAATAERMDEGVDEGVVDETAECAAAAGVVVVVVVGAVAPPAPAVAGAT
jgi:hypothetical protein